MGIFKTVWFFGLSGSEKTTLSKALSTMINETGRKSLLLDGDIIRQGIKQ